MYISHTRISDFRCLEKVTLEFKPGMNLFVGDNGSGKSSLLEALYILGRGKSFRPGSMDQCIRHGQAGFSVFARAANDGIEKQIGLLRQGGKTRLRIAGDNRVSLYELVKATPVQLIDPGIHRLSEEQPGQRRRFMDWGVFHVEHRFYPAWKRYRRALVQRNKALKMPEGAKLASSWNVELVNAGIQVDIYRRRHLDQVKSRLSDLIGPVIGRDKPFVVCYQRGWPVKRDFQEIIDENLWGDLEAGFTRVGPHRADIRLVFDAAEAKYRASRGEQKAVTVLLSLAQALAVKDYADFAPILLIDDLAAELGEQLRTRVAEVIAQSGLQCFLTFLDKSYIPAAFHQEGMFHVEHGGVTAMI